jgi:hypothetical protein
MTSSVRRESNPSSERRPLLGSSSTRQRWFKDGIEAIAAEYEADEVLIVNIVYDHAARKRSYQLIAHCSDWLVRSEPSLLKNNAAKILDTARTSIGYQVRCAFHTLA